MYLNLNSGEHGIRRHSPDFTTEWAFEIGLEPSYAFMLLPP
jgi:hypothetical protein